MISKTEFWVRMIIFDIIIIGCSGAAVFMSSNDFKMAAGILFILITGLIITGNILLYKMNFKE
jgi:hypothetical protein